MAGMNLHTVESGILGQTHSIAERPGHGRDLVIAHLAHKRFVSKAPMYVMRGPMPIRSMTHYMHPWWLKYGVKMFGRMINACGCPVNRPTCHACD